MWEAHIAIRDYAAAEKLVSAMQEQGEFGAESQGDTAIRNVSQIITYWFMQHHSSLPELVIQARTDLNKGRNSDGDLQHWSLNLEMALVTAVEGNTSETEGLIRRWRRAGAEDLAELSGARHHSCRILGMAGATAAAVDCIRSALVEPSLVMPFMEPLLPYYDSMRDEPAFVELLADIEAEDLAIPADLPHEDRLASR